jgi:hypothetical protein
MQTKHFVTLVTFLAIATSASIASALTPSYLSAAAEWTQGNPDVVLINAANNFCYLDFVTGHFVGLGEAAHVFIDGNDNWEVGGASGQQGIAAGALCVPYSTFKPEAGGVDNWTGETYDFSGPCSGCGGSGAFGVGASATFWQGDAAFLLEGVTGQFDGGGEQVTAEQASAPSAYNVLQSDAFSPNGVGGWGRALFVGVPQSGFSPLFYDSVSGPYSVFAQGGGFGPGVDSTTMIPTSEGICYFVQIGGAFAGGGEYVQIDVTTIGGVTYWNLDVQSEQDNGTSAEARCYAFNQTVSQ